MPKGRTRSTTTTTGSQTQNTTTPGTTFGTNVLSGIEQQGVMNDIFAANDGGYQGDRVAGFDVPDQFIGQWGPAPTTFVPQHTTTAAPTQTYVPTNFQEGIDVGLQGARDQSATLAGLSNQALTRWNDVLSGPGNPALSAMLQRLQQEHQEAAFQNTTALGEIFGQQGAFGGTGMGRDLAWLGEQQQQEFDAAAANLLWNDYLESNRMLQAAPAGIAGAAGLGDITAGRLLNYGGLDLANQQEAADVANFNAWQTGQLADTNADRAAQEAIAQWNAAHQIDDARSRNDVLVAEANRINNQAGLDNDAARWQGGQESIDNMLRRLMGLVSIGATVPGQSSQGTMNQTSTTTQQQSQSGLATLGSLLGAGLQFFSGNPFGAAMSLAGGLSGGGQGGSGGFSSPGMSSILQQIYQPVQYPFQPLPNVIPSSRRVKSDIEQLFIDDRGIPWYSFTYKDDPTRTPQTGVMAEDVELVAPHVVKVIDGLKHVDYGQLAEWRR